MSASTLVGSEAEAARRSIERSGPALVDTSFGTIALHVTRDLKSLRGLWEDLQTRAPCTAVQTYDWARAWSLHVLGPAGEAPLIAVGHAADGKALFLWPFETASVAGLTVLKWLGQAHANYCMGLFQPETAARFTEGDVTRLLREVAREAGAVAAVLEKQPFARDGVPNPFAKLPHLAAPNSGYPVRLGEFQTLYQEHFGKRSRDTLKRKVRNLAGAGALSFGWAETREEKLALLETFFTQKARQFAQMGITDVFDVHARAFYREMALLEGDNPSRLRLGYLKVGDAVLATFNVTLCHGRMEVALSSLAEGELQRYSPGALLLKHQIEEACAGGVSVYDLGTGAARHKEEWCDTVEPLFDSFIAFKPHGILLASILAWKARAKRFVKSSPQIYALAKKVRRALNGRETKSVD